ncbi:6-carboxyhexanoate--CoA ligase [Azotosporobacter soli]|uniref:6-carboxyhexanoate--CoA ligase n=1 Tax=Azotosporobacter soli TaxID=3055040 RepID=UPI0031FEF757
MSELYSLRMRAAQGGAHEAGGRHISGAEAILPEAELKSAALAMLERALGHSRGKADFLQLVVECVTPEELQTTPLLPVYAQANSDIEQGRRLALKALTRMGVAKEAALSGLNMLDGLSDSMRGAMLVCAKTGCRLDESGARGIRVSRIGSAEPAAFADWLHQHAMRGVHVREALLLASKVAAAPGMVAELCWSDDPEYTTGYVAAKTGYVRLPHLKVLGSPVGGRIFFVRPEADLRALRLYLEETAVLVNVPEATERSWLQHEVLP